MWFPLSVAIIASLNATPLHHQLSAERLFADSLLDQLDAASALAATHRSECAGRKAELERLCTGLILEREAELTGNADDARKAEFALERSVVDLPRFAPAWYGLGRVRLALAHDTLFSRGGALMPVGTSYLTGAANAFSEAVRRDFTFTRAQVALARTPRGREGADQLRERVAIFRRIRGAIPPDVMADVANLEREAGSVDSAVALERRALASGRADAGVVSVGLARDLYRTGKAAEGRAVLLSGAATPTAAANRAYRTELEWVASPAELNAWDALAPSQRSAWLADFWQKRDIAEGRKDGARLIEHYKRIEYAFRNFPITLPQTGRQRAVSSTPSSWDAWGDALKRALRDPGCDPELTTLAMLDHTIGSHAVKRDYEPVESEIDDRGVIWIRHGPPDTRLSDMTSEAAEIWRYNRIPIPLVLQFREVDFDGSVGATTLVSTLLTYPPETRRHFCDVEFTLCVPKDDTANPNTSLPRRSSRTPACTGGTSGPGLPEELSPDALVRAHDKGVTAIAIGTTTDTYRRDFTHAVHPGVQIVGLTHAGSADPRIVVAYALPGDELQFARTAQRVTYTIAIQLMASDSAGNRRDLDTVTTVARPAPLARGEWMSGVLELPAPAGTWHASLVLTQPDGRGAIAALGALPLMRSGADLSMSSLVLGRLSSNVRWNSGSSSVALNPLMYFPEKSSAEVFFQLHGVTPGAQITTHFNIYRASDSSGATPRVSVTSSETARAADIEINRSVGLEQLAAGHYRLEVIVENGSGSVSRMELFTIAAEQ